MKKLEMTKITPRLLSSFLMFCLLSLVTFSQLFAKESLDQIKVTLSTDKPTYKPHDDIIFTEVIKNNSKESIHLFDDTCFYGSDVRFKRVADGNEKWEMDSSSSHTVKPGMRPSHRVLLHPEYKLTRTFSAYVTDKYQIAFQNHGNSGFTGFSSGEIRIKGLPEKYIGCGYVFNLGKPGAYRVTVSYSNNEQWSNGGIGEQPKQPAWIGKATSNEVSLELK